MSESWVRPIPRQVMLAALTLACAALLTSRVGAQSDAPLFLAPTFGVGDDPISVAVGDFDGDGRQDLATANTVSDSVSVLLNQLDAWTNLGSGLPGVTGIPYLAGTGTLAVGSAGDLTLSNAAPSAVPIRDDGWGLGLTPEMNSQAAARR